MSRGSIRSAVLFLLPWCVVLCVSASTAVAGEEWLTDAERDFFTALGSHVEVNGKALRTKAQLETLSQIANRAPEPLKSRIAAISSANDDIGMTDEEKQNLREVQEDLEREVRGQLMNVMIGAFLGRDPFDTSVDATNEIMRSGGPQKAWQIQRDVLIRRLKAWERSASNLDGILSDLGTRIGNSPDAKDSKWAIERRGKQMCVTGTATDHGTAVVRVVLKKRAPNGQWTALTVASGQITEALGVKQMNGRAQATGASLAMAQELAASLPIVTTALISDLPEQSKIGVLFPLDMSLALEEVDVTVWSKDGVLTVSDLPGLEKVQKAAREVRESEMLKRMNRRQRLSYERMKDQRANMAKAALKNGLDHLKHDRLAEARSELNRAIAMDPDSTSATKARVALQKAKGK